jgi:hypothetical protein
VPDDELNPLAVAKLFDAANKIAATAKVLRRLARLDRHSSTIRRVLAAHLEAVGQLRDQAANLRAGLEAADATIAAVEAVTARVNGLVQQLNEEMLRSAEVAGHA